MPKFLSNFYNMSADENDYGKQPYAFNIHLASAINENFRLSKWTGDNLQLTLMSIEPGDDIGLEKHDDVEQFIRIESGKGYVMMGEDKDHLDYQKNVDEDYVILIPKGVWHNVVNIGKSPLKLYSIYSPPEHKKGTIHETKEDAEKDEHHH